MSVVKIHTDDLQAIYDILGDMLARKQGRPSAAAAEDLRSRATASQDLLRTMLGISPELAAAKVQGVLNTEGEFSHLKGEIAPEPTVEEVIAAIGKDITPAAPAREGDDSPV